jgi:hypothetical protein
MAQTSQWSPHRRRASGPADDLDRRRTHLDPLLVRGPGAFLVAAQQVVGVPLLGVVVLDVAGVLVAHGHEPALVTAFREDQALQPRVFAGVAHGLQQPGRLRLRDEHAALGQVQHRLVEQLDLRGAGLRGLGGVFPGLLRIRRALGVGGGGGHGGHGGGQNEASQRGGKTVQHGGSSL